MEQTLTHHCIDDAGIGAEQALEQFRIQFPLSGVSVRADGMSYSFQRTSTADSLLRDAEQLIKAQNLPLEASLYKGLRGCTLSIDYKKR